MNAELEYIKNISDEYLQTQMTWEVYQEYLLDAISRLDRSDEVAKEKLARALSQATFE